MLEAVRGLTNLLSKEEDEKAQHHGDSKLPPSLPAVVQLLPLLLPSDLPGLHVIHHEAAVSNAAGRAQSCRGRA